MGKSLAELSSEALNSGKAKLAFDLAQQAVKQKEDKASLRALGFAANATSQSREAERAWRRLTEISPDSAGPWEQLCTVYSRARRWQDILETADAAIDHGHALESFEIKKLESFSQLGRIDEAREVAARIEALIPDSSNPARAGLLLAQWYQEKGDINKALKLADDAAKIAPEAPESFIFLGRYFYRLQRTDKALRYYEQAIANGANANVQSEFQIVTARAAAKQNRAEDAERAYARGLELVPGHADRAFEYFSFLYNHPIRPLEPVLEQMREKFGDEDPRVLMAEALFFTRRKDFPAAKDAYERAMRLHPKNTRIAYAYAAFLMNRASTNAAIDVWRRVCQADPKAVEPRRNLLVSITRSGGPIEEVVEEAQALLRLDPLNRDGLLQLGQAYQRQGKFDLAAQNYSKGIEHHPRTITFWQNTVGLLLSSDDYKGVDVCLAKAEKVFDGGGLQDWMSLSRIYSSAEKFDRAEEAARKASKEDPENREPLDFLLSHLLSKGDLNGVREIVVKLRKVDPVDINVAAASARLYAFDVSLRDKQRDAGLVPECILEAICVANPPQRLNHDGREPSAVLVTSSLGSGGAERQVAYTILGSDRVEHEFSSVNLLTDKLKSEVGRDFFLPEIEASGRNVIPVGEDKSFSIFRRAQSSGVISLENLLKFEACGPEFIKFGIPLYSYFASQRPSVVHLWQDWTAIIGGFAAVAAGVPRIILATRSTRPDTRRRLRRYMFEGYKLLMQRPEVVMVNNSTAGARDYEDWLGLKPDTVGVIHNGLDIEKVRENASRGASAKIRDMLSIPPDAPVIGGVLRFSEEKRPELCAAICIEACRRHPDLHGIIVGAGQLHPEVSEQIKRAGLADRIHLPGAKRPVEPWIKAMDMLILTSRMEGLPNVLIEAQALGVPVCSARVGGAPEAILENETGILFESNADPADIAQSVMGFIKDRARYEVASRKATSFVESKFSIDAMTQRTLEVYRGGPCQMASDC